MCSSQRCAGNGAGTRARLNSAEAPVKTCSSPQIATSSSTTVSGRVAIAISDLEPGRLAGQLEDVEDLDPRRLALLAQRPLGPRARRDERLDAVELLRLLDPPAADLSGQIGLLDPQVRAGARAVGPLRDAVDVDELEARDRAQDLARRLP